MGEKDLQNPETPLSRVSYGLSDPPFGWQPTEEHMAYRQAAKTDPVWAVKLEELDGREFECRAILWAPRKPWWRRLFHV